MSDLKVQLEENVTLVKTFRTLIDSLLQENAQLKAKLNQFAPSVTQDEKLSSAAYAALVTATKTLTAKIPHFTGNASHVDDEQIEITESSKLIGLGMPSLDSFLMSHEEKSEPGQEKTKTNEAESDESLDENSDEESDASTSTSTEEEQESEGEEDDDEVNRMGNTDTDNLRHHEGNYLDTPEIPIPTIDTNPTQTDPSPSSSLNHPSSVLISPRIIIQEEKLTTQVGRSKSTTLRSLPEIPKTPSNDNMAKSPYEQQSPRIPPSELPPPPQQQQSTFVGKLSKTTESTSSSFSNSNQKSKYVPPTHNYLGQNRHPTTNH